MSKKPAPVRITDAEWTAMRVVWDRGAATARDVTDALAGDTGWAYTTVKTLLTRLTQKGALRESMRGNQSVYEAVVGRDQARRAAVRSMVDRAFGGLVPMVRFLLEDETLSEGERTRLRELLATHGAGNDVAARERPPAAAKRPRT